MCTLYIYFICFAQYSVSKDRSHHHFYIYYFLETGISFVCEFLLPLSTHYSLHALLPFVYCTGIYISLSFIEYAFVLLLLLKRTKLYNICMYVTAETSLM
jgi:hypothetical protein